MTKQRKIEERIQAIDKRLANAEAYVARGKNVEGRAWLHFDDLNGRSGHPLWMKNFMIPVMIKARTINERLLETVSRKDKEKQLKQRKQQKSE